MLSKVSNVKKVQKFIFVTISEQNEGVQNDRVQNDHVQNDRVQNECVQGISDFSWKHKRLKHVKSNIIFMKIVTT